MFKKYNGRIINYKVLNIVHRLMCNPVVTSSVGTKMCPPPTPPIGLNAVISTSPEPPGVPQSFLKIPPDIDFERPLTQTFEILRQHAYGGVSANVIRVFDTG